MQKSKKFLKDLTDSAPTWANVRHKYIKYLLDKAHPAPDKSEFMRWFGFKFDKHAYSDATRERQIKIEKKTVVFDSYRVQDDANGFETWTAMRKAGKKQGLDSKKINLITYYKGMLKVFINK